MPSTIIVSPHHCPFCNVSHPPTRSGNYASPTVAIALHLYVGDSRASHLPTERLRLVHHRKRRRPRKLRIVSSHFSRIFLYDVSGVYLYLWRRVCIGAGMNEYRHIDHTPSLLDSAYVSYRTSNEIYVRIGESLAYY